MKKLRYKGKFSGKESMINVQVSIISFIDDNTHILYCPALDLSGYGIDETDAKRSFDIVLEEYISYTTNKGSLWNDLKKLGWGITKKNKEATPPSMTQLLEKNEEFSRIFNNYPFKKFNTGVVLPAYA